MASNRDRLIEAASTLFHQRGYHATSVDEVLAATGISKSNLYYHFASKAELAAAVARHWTAVYDEHLVGPSLGDTALRPLERVRRLYELAAASQNEEAGFTGCPLGRLATDLAAGEPEVRAVLTEYFDGLRGRLRTTFAEAASVDGARTVEGRWDGLTETAVALLEGGLLLSNLRGQGDGITVAGDSFLSLLEPLLKSLDSF